MRRGIPFMSLPNPPVDDKPMATEIFGIPIKFDPYSPHTAIARGLWWNRHIVVGPNWALMDDRTAHAVALHEAKHCLAFHMEQRVLGFLLLCRVAAAIILFFGLFGIVEAWFSRQELEADAFAVENGYGVELLQHVM